MNATRLILFCLIFFANVAWSEQWKPQNGLVQQLVWPATVPNARPSSAPEDMRKRENLVAGNPWFEVSNVTNPTFTVYPPKGKNTRAAIIVFPGGGYQVLAIDLEGTEVCDWMTSKGITCVLLKYRVPGSGPNWDPVLRKRIIPKILTALQDAQRTLSTLRHRTLEFNLDPQKIGVIGFSAGGHLVATISTESKRSYAAIDEIDIEDFHPNFSIALYPGHLSNADDLSKLNPSIHVTKEVSPTLLIHAQDDPVDPVEYSLLYFGALKKIGVPVEMHIFAQGKHAFGLRPTEFPITRWPDLAEKWLKTIHMIE